MPLFSRFSPIALVVLLSGATSARAFIPNEQSLEGKSAPGSLSRNIVGEWELSRTLDVVEDVCIRIAPVDSEVFRITGCRWSDTSIPATISDQVSKLMQGSGVAFPRFSLAYLSNLRERRAEDRIGGEKPSSKAVYVGTEPASGQDFITFNVSDQDTDALFVTIGTQSPQKAASPKGKVKFDLRHLTGVRVNAK